MTKEIIKKERLEGYSNILKDIRSLLEKAKLQAYKAVDNIRVQTYWQIGERIAREEFRHRNRADYGKKIIERLGIDTGFSQALLWRIIQFYKEYPILVTVSRELSWSHYEVLITIKNKEERRFYEAYIIANRCSVRELRKEIFVSEYRVKLPSEKEIIKKLK